MTPEQRARAIINSGEYLYAVEQIRQAIEEEKEACAKTATGCLYGVHAAAAIRAREG